VPAINATAGTSTSSHRILAITSLLGRLAPGRFVEGKNVATAPG
jgi:hypothetical protein